MNCFSLYFYRTRMLFFFLNAIVYINKLKTLCRWAPLFHSKYCWRKLYIIQLPLSLLPPIKRDFTMKPTEHSPCCMPAMLSLYWRVLEGWVTAGITCQCGSVTHIPLLWLFRLSDAQTVHRCFPLGLIDFERERCFRIQVITRTPFVLCSSMVVCHREQPPSEASEAKAVMFSMNTINQMSSLCMRVQLCLGGGEIAKVPLTSFCKEFCKSEWWG